ncbi:HDIG domain-containing protein [bacterium]|nr:HDIG domain-containing protein [bacterium]
MSETNTTPLINVEAISKAALVVVTSVIVTLITIVIQSTLEIRALPEPLAIVLITYTFLVTIIFGVTYLFCKSVWSSFNPTLRDLALLYGVLIFSITVLEAHVVLGRALSSTFKALSPEDLVYAAPLAVGGILLQVTLSTPSVVFFVICFTLISGLFFPGTWILPLIICLGNFTAILNIKRWSRRAAFLRAGLQVAAINLVLVFSALMIDGDLNAADAPLRLAFALLGGLVSGMFGAMLTPVAEYFGSYLTDIKLLELSSLDHPLLRELSVGAPGTWNHSIVMGQMSEAGSEAIGANSLLARVGAYYHDIGKTKKPEYFVENQADDENRHDKLTPSMSALIIKAHVKDGVEMAKEHKLPQAVIDFIPQHHGTSIIKYFYDKAVKDAANDEEVEEQHFRYPGPKPQTKEAGILMLADSIEASVRTLSDPTPARIQGVVQKMINNIFSSGQLDECDLTLQDLHQIAKSFTRVLTGIHHKRIEYSEPVEKRNKDRDEQQESSQVDHSKTNEGEVKDARGGAATGERQGTANKSEDSKDRKETLKRLGI